MILLCVGLCGSVRACSVMYNTSGSLRGHTIVTICNLLLHAIESDKHDTKQLQQQP